MQPIKKIISPDPDLESNSLAYLLLSATFNVVSIMIKDGRKVAMSAELE